MKQYDAIIIGFGKAGKTLAAELSPRMAGCHHRTLRYDVWGLLSEHCLYPDKNPDT